MLEALLTVMLALAPRESEARLRTVAGAIATAASTPGDAAVLVAISFHETRFEHSGVPFGVVSWRRRVEGQPLEVGARAALQMYGYASHCGTSVAVRLGWYHTGHCRADAWSLRETATVEHVLVSLPRNAAPVVTMLPAIALSAVASHHHHAHHHHHQAAR